MDTYNRLQKAIIENGGVVCEQAPDAFFFEEENKDANLAYKTATAKKICADCPVRMLCLEYALESNEVFGIWGGLTGAERKKLKQGRRGSEVIHRSDSRRPEWLRVRLSS